MASILGKSEGGAVKMVHIAYDITQQFGGETPNCMRGDTHQLPLSVIIHSYTPEARTSHSGARSNRFLS